MLEKYKEYRKFRMSLKLISIIICFVILLVLFILNPNIMKEYDEIKNIYWKTTINNRETLMYLDENTTFEFFYLDPKETVGGYEDCNRYSIDAGDIKLSCNQPKIKVKSASNKTLELEIEGTKYKFKNAALDYEVFKTGYIKDAPEAIIIKSYDEFKNYLSLYKNETYDGEGNVIKSTSDEILKKYKEDTFNDKNLAIYYIETSSSGAKLNKINPIVVGNTLNLIHVVEYSQEFTNDMSGYMVLVEIDKNITTLV